MRYEQRSVFVVKTEHSRYLIQARSFAEAETAFTTAGIGGGDAANAYSIESAESVWVCVE